MTNHAYGQDMYVVRYWGWVATRNVQGHRWLPHIFLSLTNTVLTPPEDCLES